MSEKGKENYQKFIKEKTLKIGILGNSQKGKSFILNKISKIDLKKGPYNQTTGISIKYGTH